MSNTTDASPLSSSPTIEQQAQVQAPQPQSQSQPTKRSSRRANTAERRATHNAVERLRRETLNGRFLDLAAILPALAAQRRPSKSAIVNHSIQLITTQRRNRIIAARELRLISTENDALRQELNEWRTRNSLPRVEEPPRSPDLLALLAVPEEGEGDDDDDVLGERRMMERRRAAFEMGPDEDECFGDDEELLSPDSAHPYAGPGSTTLTIPAKVHASVHQQQLQQQQHAQQLQQNQQQQQAHYAAQQAAVFEQQTAAMVRAQMAAARATYPSQQQQQQQQQVYTATDNFFPDMYAPTPEYNNSAPPPAWSQKAASTLATPPGTSHGHSHGHGHGHGHGQGNGMKNESSPYAATTANNSAFLSSSPYGSGSPYGSHPHQHPHPHQHQGGGSLGMFKPRDDDGDSSVSVGESSGTSTTGSSHFSSLSDLSNSMLLPGGGGPSTSPVDHPFSFNMGMMMMNPMQMSLPVNTNMGMMPMMGMNGMNGMNMMGMPSPPHSGSPGGSQPQSRRPSINIPSSYNSTTTSSGNGGGSKRASPNPSPGPTPTQAQTQFVGMGLMM